MKRRLLIISDGGPEVGYGHLVRCSQIAGGLPADRWEVTVATDADVGRATALFFEHAEIVPLGNSCPQFGTDQRWDWALIDSFQLGPAFEDVARAYVRRIAVIDGLLRPTRCDLLIDPIMRDLSARVEAGQRPGRTLDGPDHIPMNPRFAELAGRMRQEPPRLGIALGGAGHQKDVEALVEALSRIEFLGELSIIAPQPITSAANLRFSQSSWQDDMPSFLGRCELLIGNCGMSAWERCAAGTPSLAFVTADNQKFVSQTLRSHDAAMVCDIRPSLVKIGELDAAIGEFLNDLESQSRYARNGPRICDGKGVARITAALESIG